MDSKVREKMTDYLVDLVALGVGAVVVPLITSNLSSEAKAAYQTVITAITGLVFLAIPYLLSLRRNRKFKPGTLLVPQGIVKAEGYWLPWPRLLLYGTLLFVGVTELASVFAGWLLGFFMGAVPTNLFLGAFIPSTLLSQGFIAFVIGRWIGARIDKRGLLTMLASVLLARLILVSLDRALNPVVLDNALTYDWSTVMYFILFTLFVWAFGWVGYWRGSKTKQASYVWYLLSSLPDDSRQTMMDLMYEEASRMSPQPAASASAPSRLEGSP